MIDKDNVIDKDKLRKLCAKSTPAPWKFDEPSAPAGAVEVRAEGLDEFGDPIVVADWVRQTGDVNDAAFITAVRTAVPELLDENDRLRAEVERMQPVYEAAKAWHEATEGKRPPMPTVNGRWQSHADLLGKAVDAALLTEK